MAYLRGTVWEYLHVDRLAGRQSHRRKRPAPFSGIFRAQIPQAMHFGHVDIPGVLNFTETLNAPALPETAGHIGEG